VTYKVAKSVCFAFAAAVFVLVAFSAIGTAMGQVGWNEPMRNFTYDQHPWMACFAMFIGGWVGATVLNRDRRRDPE
jgi:hypothetical protein